MNRRIPDPLRLQIIGEYDSGIKMDDLSKKYGVSSSTIYSIVKKERMELESDHPGEVEEIKKRLSGNLIRNVASINSRITEAIKSVPIETATDLRNMSVSLGILHDHARLQDNESTANVALLVSCVEKALAGI